MPEFVDTALASNVDGSQSRSHVQMNYSRVMLEQVAQDPEFGPQVRVYFPDKTVAFSRRETFLPGFEAAQRVAREMGYEPVIRPAGGRAVAYHTGSLVFDLVIPEPRLRYNSEFIFREFGSAMVAMLRSMGVDARLGPVSGEYCPGKYSINARDRVKLMGTAQRASRGARLVSGSMLLDNSEEVREVLIAVNRELNFDWEPQTVGSLFEELGTLNAERVQDFLASELKSFGDQLFRQEYF